MNWSNVKKYFGVVYNIWLHVLEVVFLGGAFVYLYQENQLAAFIMLNLCVYTRLLRVLR